MKKIDGASIRNIAQVLWETPPAHYDAHSKMLVTPEKNNTRQFDFRISSYQPKGYVEPHVHKIQEQIYHIIEGTGLMELDGEHHLVKVHDYIFIPPGINHAIYNTGLVDLVFFVITSPPSDS